MNAPISSLVDEEEDETQSLFMQLTSSLSLAEMLAVMQGNLGAIQGLNQKLRNILLNKMDGVDTPDKRRELAEGEAEKFKSMLFIPGEVVSNVHEGFDPLLVSGEVVDTHFATILDVILDFDARRDDSQFIEEMKDALAYFIGEWIDELQDGFMNGMQDVVVFYRENFKVIIRAGAGPEMGEMLGGIGTNTVMQYVTIAFTRYREKKAQFKAAAKQKIIAKQQQKVATPHEDVKMDHSESEEESKEESPETIRKRFMSKWQAVIDRDVEQMASPPHKQRPLSRAYLSLCPSSRVSNKQVQDEKNSANEYLAHGANKKKEHFKEENVKQTIRANLMTAGYPQAKVDEAMGKVDSLPESLVHSYYEMLREDVINRVRNDPDFNDKRGPDGKTPYEYLDKLL